LARRVKVLSDLDFVGVRRNEIGVARQRTVYHVLKHGDQRVGSHGMLDVVERLLQRWGRSMYDPWVARRTLDQHVPQQIKDG